MRYPSRSTGTVEDGGAATTVEQGPSGPATFRDDQGRDIRFRPYEPTAPDALVGMYADFDPSQRAQGIPPVRTPEIESWLDDVLAGPSMLAWHGDRVVGHVLFVPDGSGGHELAIFVHQAYQGAGIGSRLIRAGLDHAEDRGVTLVWLLVGYGNHRARALYESAGFSVDDPTGSDLRLSRRL
jgi:ribosomal protein S18 acetylase RimI-like enzyme